MIIDGIGQNIQNDISRDRYLFSMNSSKQKHRLKSSNNLEVSPANYECHFASVESAHWNATVRGMSVITLMKLGEELGGPVVDGAIAEFRKRREERVRLRNKRDDLWELLEQKVRQSSQQAVAEKSIAFD